MNLEHASSPPCSPLPLPPPPQSLHPQPLLPSSCRPSLPHLSARLPPCPRPLLQDQSSLVPSVYGSTLRWQHLHLQPPSGKYIFVLLFIYSFNNFQVDNIEQNKA